MTWFFSNKKQYKNLEKWIPHKILAKYVYIKEYNCSLIGCRNGLFVAEVTYQLQYRDFGGGKEVTGELQEPKTRLPNQIKINITEYW